MGFASGSISYRRYQISGPHPRSVDDQVIESLRRHAFGCGGKVSPEGLEVGWIAPTHLFDTEIEAEKVTVGHFLHLALRLDRLAAPPAVVRSYRRMEEDAARDASGRAKLSAEELRQAKEAAQARADKEARQGRFRRIAAHRMFLDFENHSVYFGSLANGPHDELRLLFASTFGATLVPMDAAEVASQVVQAAGRHRAYQDAVPVHLIDPPAGAASGNGNGSVDAADRSFLGREFLTWLWHRVETSGGEVPVASNGRHTLPGRVSVAVDRVVRLDCDFGLTGHDMVYADAPASAPEARAALRIGKQPSRMGLILSAGGEQYSLTLDATRWQASGLTLPTSDEPDPRVRLEERLMQLARCTAILDGLFASFLTARFDGGFAKQLGQLRQWASNGHNGSGRAAAVDTEQTPLRVIR